MNRWLNTPKSIMKSPKISLSGMKVIAVPDLLRSTLGRGSDTSSDVFLPRENSCVCRLPSRVTSTVNFSERAFTTEAPTPCRPPDTE